MKNLVFVFWFLGWPLVVSICNYIDAKRRMENQEEKWNNKDSIAPLIILIIWIGISSLVYEK